MAVYKELTNAPNFWDRSTVDQNVFSTMRIDGYRAFDPNSVMMKFFPGHYFTDGVERGGKKELSEGDKAFARKLYPPG